MFKENKLHLILLLGFSLFIVGCQPKVYLMPSPTGIDPQGQFFDQSKNSKDANMLHTLYATNRKPIETLDQSIQYSIFPSDTLKLGTVAHRVGDEGMTWADIQTESLKAKRSKDLLLTQVSADELVSYHIEDDLHETSKDSDAFFQKIDKLLDDNIDKDILVYVHGANCNFYRATAQGAQYYHFTGHNSVVITFSWPSAENILKYKTDVLHAKQTIPAFARLIELLATHTKAKHINLLAYSAGAQVAAPGLAYLVDAFPDMTRAELKDKLRIGEVYFAAPDAEFKTFAQRYLKFRDIVERTTVNINENDSVLKLSAFQNGFSRLGKPDYSEVTTDQLDVLVEASKTQKFDLIDIAGSEDLDLGGAHDSWYNHPWVSTDVLLLLMLNMDPYSRGLKEHWYEDGSKGFRFPKDYENMIKNRTPEEVELMMKKLQSESGD